MYQQLSSNRDWVAGWDPDNKWFNFPLILKDRPIGFAKEICPNTIQILQDLGGINTAGFAIILPHSRLPVHTDPTGPTYGTMAFNMLLSGKNSSLIVGKSPPYKHKLGKAVLFNSELEHYARNDSDDIRTILYMDIVLRP
jgi:aspartyl/asparaginyl beta-hydroxylase (cupin superfamily)